MTKEHPNNTWKPVGTLTTRVLDNLRAITQRKPEPETHTNSTNNATPTNTNTHATVTNAMPVKTNMFDLQRGGRARYPAASQGGRNVA